MKPSILIALVAGLALAGGVSAQSPRPRDNSIHTSAWEQKEAARRAKDARFSARYHQREQQRTAIHARMLAKHQAHDQRLAEQHRAHAAH